MPPPCRRRLRQLGRQLRPAPLWWDGTLDKDLDLLAFWWNDGGKYSGTSWAPVERHTHTAA